MPTTRQEARDLGASQYHTGNPCPKGHVSPRYTRNGGCVFCNKEYAKSPQAKSSVSSRMKIYKALPHVKVAANEASKKSQHSIKIDVISHYGGKCACCGESGLVFLCVDHIDGDGAEHRRETKTSTGIKFYRWLIKNKFPRGFQVLCWNCNSAKHILGSCPHQKGK